MAFVPGLSSSLGRVCFQQEHSCTRLLPPQWGVRDGISSSFLLLPRCFLYFFHIFPPFKESGKIVQQVI